MSVRVGLGKGLGSLIPEGFDSSLLVEPSDRIHIISVEKILPNPDQPRTFFEDSSLTELANSIKQYGIVQPIVVSPQGETYLIIAGERRWRAAQIVGLSQVPAIVRTAEELERLELALVENVQRVDLSVLEQALSIERLHQQFNVPYSELAQRLGKANSTINNIVRLLQLPEEARRALQENRISEGHARQILALKNAPDQQAELLALIEKHGWSVRQSENFVSSVKEGFEQKSEVKARMLTDTPETKKLAKRYGTKVQIRRTAKGGKIEIAFTSDDQLAELLSELSRV